VKSLERYIILNAIDRLWQEHLYAMDALREGVYLRGYAQKDPLIEYKTEAYDMFVELMANIKNEVLNNLFRSTSNLQAFENFLATLPQFLKCCAKKRCCRNVFRGGGENGRTEMERHLSGHARFKIARTGSAASAGEREDDSSGA
jgi:preprotein translocase subunit SecA